MLVLLDGWISSMNGALRRVSPLSRQRLDGELYFGILALAVAVVYVAVELVTAAGVAVVVVAVGVVAVALVTAAGVAVAVVAVAVVLAAVAQVIIRTVEQ